ncbi:hypothetical protein RXV95_04180 [Novosphingobium sp. ZN18A2]|uniref:hypothetical protein n=1 Tax=Novosphingobium sp. ZN18A2 TaxID=3079861 RepID=UPI0030CBBCA8
MQPLTDPAALTLHDVAMLADPPAGAPRVDCSGKARDVAARLARAEAGSFGAQRAKLLLWGVQAVGHRDAGGRLWTLESEVTDPASGAVQIVQRDYLMATGSDGGCAYWPLTQKVLEWRRNGSVRRAGEGKVLVN